MNNLNANQFPEVYKQLGISTSHRGCIMLDIEPLIVNDIIAEDQLYVSPKGNYIDGIVSEEVPHITLLYGLLHSGPEMQLAVDQVLQGWSCESVSVAGVSYFESNDADEDYYAIVARVDVTDTLTEGNGRLRFLPHIDTFVYYQPHITLAYIKKDDKVRDDAVYALNERFAGKQVRALGLNYGD